LQCPAPREPSASGEIVFHRIAIIRRKIRKEDKTNLGILVPSKHRINSLGQLSATALINATGVNPSVLDSTVTSKSTGALNLGESLLPPGLLEMRKVVKGDFVAFPCM
jgi:hypothetical protein